jgi:hypothetical protein
VPDLQIASHQEYDNAKVLVNARDVADTTGQTDVTTLDASPVDNPAVISAGLMLPRPINLSLTARDTIERDRLTCSKQAAYACNNCFRWAGARRSSSTIPSNHVR